MNIEPDRLDAVIVGGGAAGLSAALALGRATRRVLVASCGPTRNAPSHGAHNVFTRDGTPPAELVRIGRAQLEPYAVTFRDACVEDAFADGAWYRVRFADGHEVLARGIVLASGVRDLLPEVPGFRALWGTGVFHCPYCHGWEVAGRPLGIHARGDAALHLATLLRVWTEDLILFTDGPSELGDDDLARLRAGGVVVREERVVRLEGVDALHAVVLEHGEVVPRAGLFTAPRQTLGSDLHRRLGCTETDLGRVAADAKGRTDVERVYVAGDAAPGMQAIPWAAATGMLAGAALNFELAAADLGARAAA